MKNFRRIFKYVYLPVFIGSLMMIGLYTLFHYLVVIKFNVVEFKAIMIEVFLPIVVSVSFAYFFARRRLKLLRLSEKLREGLVFTFGIALAASMIVFQLYFIASIEKLTFVDNTSSIDDLPETRFYNISDFNTTMVLGGYWISHKITDRNRTKYSVNVYFVYSVPDTNKKHPIWVGRSYTSKEFDYALRDDSVQIKEIREFVELSQKEVMNYSFSDHHYYERLKQAEAADSYLPAILASKGSVPEDVVILIPAKGTYESRTGSKLEWFVGIFFACQLGFFLMIVKRRLTNR